MSQAKPDHLIFGVHITDRLKQVADVQKLLTEYGCNIKTRLGLHEASEHSCAPNGILLLEMVGDPKRCRELCDKLNAISGVEAREIRFGHD